MKIKFIILVVILIILMTLFNVISNSDGEVLFKPLELEVGEEFTSLKYDKPMYVLNYAIEDVTGDNEKDMVIIIGERNLVAEDNMAKNIDVVVYEPTNNIFIKSGLKKCEGVSSKIITADVNGNQINDVILLTENEDMTRNMRVITIENGICKEIFKLKDNKSINMIGTFMDGFKAQLSAKKINYSTEIDLKDKKENYVTSGFYNENGKLASDKKNITLSNFIEVELVELNNQYGIKTSQYLKGFDNLDILDQINIIWKYENGEWKIKEAEGENLGNLLY